MTFAVIWKAGGPGRELVRRLTVPLGVQCHAEMAARELGWDGKENLIYYDSDGKALGGTVFKEG